MVTRSPQLLKFKLWIGEQMSQGRLCPCDTYEILAEFGVNSLTEICDEEITVARQRLEAVANERSVECQSS